jgi:prepilin-type N-terminal cleavage/methylation domain-containing protein
MTSRNQSGFTIVELMVAVLILGLGITALVGSSALATRQIGRGRIVTIANEVATRRLEMLRLAARPIGGGAVCTQAGFASSPSPVTSRGVTESWTITGVAPAKERTAVVTVTYPRQGGTSTITLSTIIGCY